MLEEYKINIKIKLAALWTAVMFLYIYIDYFHLYKPGTITNIIAGKVWEFDITQTFMMIGLTSVAVPALMIYLSLVLKAKINRRLNIIVGVFYAIYASFNLIGESWIFYYWGFFIELILFVLIVRSAWRWPILKK
jgi:hypothetical protein